MFLEGLIMRIRMGWCFFDGLNQGINYLCGVLTLKLRMGLCLCEGLILRISK